MTAAGAASLASALQNCPHITEIKYICYNVIFLVVLTKWHCWHLENVTPLFWRCSLSDNNLKDTGIKHIADVCTKLPRLVSLMWVHSAHEILFLSSCVTKISLILCIRVTCVYVCLAGWVETTSLWKQWIIWSGRCLHVWTSSTFAQSTTTHIHAHIYIYSQYMYKL